MITDAAGLTRGLAQTGRATRRRVARLVVAGYDGVVAVTAVVLLVRQVGMLTEPCTVPGCVWPRLSAAGFTSVAALGLPPGAWIVCAAALSALSIVVPFLLGVIVARSAQAPVALPMLWFTFSLGTVSGVPDGLAAVLLRTLTLAAWFTLFALFPSARFRPRWVIVAPIGATLWTIVLMLPPIAARESANDPLWWGLEAGGYLLCVGTIVAAQIVQFRRGGAQTRRRIGLLLVVFAVFLAFGAMNAVLNLRLDPADTGYGSLGGALMYEASGLVTLLLIGCVAVVMVRDGAYGARIVMDRVLVTSIALLGAGVIYAVVVAVASAVLRGWMPSALAGIATAVVLASSYARIAHGIGRLVHGDADDPAAVAAALDARVADAADPGMLLPAIAETLSRRLRFPAVRITGADGGDAASGSLRGRVATVPLRLDGRGIGVVEVALRPAQRRLTSRDRRALAAAAGPLATALTARRLTAEVRRSRLDVLIGRDEERRALRRRLHDEVGPTLALAGHRIEAARTDPAGWSDAAQTVHDALAQVRAISRELRPPALDELGLGPALDAFATGLGLHATVRAPEQRLPGVVEVAAYRIAVEALVNAVRHGGARSADVRVSADTQDCELVIDDDGSGIPDETVPGVGLGSMRERAHELGGNVTIAPRASGGTRVRARIPLPVAPAPIPGAGS